jgi:hypothetical protein
MQVTKTSRTSSEKLEATKVQEFKYLGRTVTNDGNMDKKLINRIILANKCYCKLKVTFKSHFITLITKLRLYKTLLRLVLMYGSESWKIPRCNVNSLSVFERDML